MAGCDVNRILVAKFMEFIRCRAGARAVITVDKDAGGLVREELGHFLGYIGAWHV